jgi:protoporphyrinogen oxidase
MAIYANIIGTLQSIILYNMILYNMIYDIIIIGSGIAGLNIYNRLLDQNKYDNILLIDKNGYVGGRIYTISLTLSGIKHTLEAGGARFNNKHKKLIKLIKEYNLTNDVIKINSSSLDFLPRFKKWKNNPISNRLPYDYIDDILANYPLDPTISKYTFKEWLYLTVDKNIANYIVDSYPYMDMFKTNAYDALRLYKINMDIGQPFYVLKNGLSVLINKMARGIKKNHGTIQLNTDCIDIERKGNSYIITCVFNNKRVRYVTNKLVLACQQSQIKKFKIFKPVHHLINAVSTTVLLRIYFIFKVPKQGVWFKHLKKTLTDSKIQYFIPIDYNKGSVMISYSDDSKAKFLKNLESKDTSNFIKFIIDECKNIFGINNIPLPIWHKLCYWNSGVGIWKKNVDSYDTSKKILRPFKRKPLFICSENYSKNYQGWIEGSLETSDKVFKLL